MKENIFVAIITLFVVAGGIHVRMSDRRYIDTDQGAAVISGNKIIFGKDMSIQGLSSGSTVATGGSMMYFFVNDTCTIQFDFKSRIKAVNFDSASMSVTVLDSTYTIPYDGHKSISQFATEVPPIPIASLKLFSQSVSCTE